MIVTFAIVRDSTCDPSVTEEWLSRQFAPALAIYLQRDVSVDWGFVPPIVLVNVFKTRDAVPAGAYALVFKDALPEAPGALAYHDEDDKGRVFAPIATVGYSLQDISVSASHEAVEALGNPSADLWADRVSSDEEARELADRVEEWSYPVNGVNMSDYLLPVAFDTHAASGTTLDKMGMLVSPAIRGANSYVILRKNGVSSTDPPERAESKHANSRGGFILGKHP